MELPSINPATTSEQWLRYSDTRFRPVRKAAHRRPRQSTGLARRLLFVLMVLVMYIWNGPTHTHRDTHRIYSEDLLCSRWLWGNQAWINTQHLLHLWEIMANYGEWIESKYTCIPMKEKRERELLQTQWGRKKINKQKQKLYYKSKQFSITKLALKQIKCLFQI